MFYKKRDDLIKSKIIKALNKLNRKEVRELDDAISDLKETKEELLDDIIQDEAENCKIEWGIVSERKRFLQAQETIKRLESRQAERGLYQMIFEDGNLDLLKVKQLLSQIWGTTEGRLLKKLIPNKLKSEILKPRFFDKIKEFFSGGALFSVFKGAIFWVIFAKVFPDANFFVPWGILTVYFILDENDKSRARKKD